MARRILYTDAFRDALAGHSDWLKRNRPKAQRARFRAALQQFRKLVLASPRIGRENETVGSSSIRAFPLPGLPLLVWYAFDEADSTAPILFLMLWHERQDRGAVSPSGYMP